MGKAWRSRSPEKVIEEIKLLKQEWQIEHLLIEDDNLTLDKKRAEKIFDLLIKAGLGITWSTPNGVRADKNETSRLHSPLCCPRIRGPNSG